jgi:hypothetical protein
LLDNPSNNRSREERNRLEGAGPTNGGGGGTDGGGSPIGGTVPFADDIGGDVSFTEVPSTAKTRLLLCLDADADVGADSLPNIANAAAIARVVLGVPRARYDSNSVCKTNASGISHTASAAHATAPATQERQNMGALQTHRDKTRTSASETRIRVARGGRRCARAGMRCVSIETAGFGVAARVAACRVVL